MARKKDFDEMTLITEESTINEPYNQAKKEAQLRELHRQINGSQSQPDNEFQFYPNSTIKTDKQMQGTAQWHQTVGAKHQADGGIDIPQDSVQTVTIDGAQQQAAGHASLMDQFDQSQSRFGESLIDESFAGTGKSRKLDQMAVTQSQQKPVNLLPSAADQEEEEEEVVDFQNRELPIETEPASPNKQKPSTLGSSAKVVKQPRSFMRNAQNAASDEKQSPVQNQDFLNQQTQNTPIHQPAGFNDEEDEEDIIEQTFGVGDVQRNNQVFDNLPTPKSRMKRQIDLENDTSVVSAGGPNVGLQGAIMASAVAATGANEQKAGGAGERGQGRRFEETGKRKSEHNVLTENVEDEIKAPVPIARNQLYAASQKNIETVDPQVHQPVGIGLQSGTFQEPKIYEQPVEVNNLASYFDKMQVGKKTGSANKSPGINTHGSNEKKPSSRQPQVQAAPLQQPQKQTRPSRDSQDFNNIEEIAPPDMIQEGAISNVAQGLRSRIDSFDNMGSNSGKNANSSTSKQASKYQIRASSPNDKERVRQQISRTGSPQKKASIVSSKNRDTLESGLQTSNTPILKETGAGKALGLKNKLQEALQNNKNFSADNFTRHEGAGQQAVDATTKKMIIGYQQLKRRKHASSGCDVDVEIEGNNQQQQPNSQFQSNNANAVIEAARDSGATHGRDSGAECSPPMEMHHNSGNQKTAEPSRQQTNNKEQPSHQEDQQPQRAKFQMAIVGYREKRMKSELEQELEASLRDVKGLGYTESSGGGGFTNTSAIKAGRMKNLRALEIDDERDLAISSDLEVNLASEIQGPLRTRKLYSQQKRGTRKKILASGLKKTKEFKEKTNTIEHVGGVSRGGLDSNFQIEGRRLIDQIEIDNQSGGTQGNLLNNVDDLADGFNGSNFDMQSVHGQSQNQYAGGQYHGNHMPMYGMNRGVLSQTGSTHAKRITQMQQYQYIKGKGQQKNIGYYDGHAAMDSRPLSHGQNWYQKQQIQKNYTQDIRRAPEHQHMAQHMGAPINSIEALRDDFLNELPKSINIHSNPGSGRQNGALRFNNAQTETNGQQQSDLHDVSFKATKNEKIPAGKPRLETLSSATLANVCKFLKPEETARLTMTTKQLKKSTEHKDFDSLWVLFSFQTIFSKTGLTGLKNASQRRIDEALHQMHFQCESIRRDAKEVQVSLFEKWLAISLILVLISMPILLVLKHDFEKDLTLQIVLMPVTVAWGLLLFAQLYAWYRIQKYYKRVIGLHLTQPQYKMTEKDIKDAAKESSPKADQGIRVSPNMHIEITKSFFQKAVYGRNTKHCSLYTFGSFVNRFAMMNMLGLSCIYLAFFLKIYILHDSVTYLQLAPLAVAPLLLMYGYEMIGEICKDRSNWSQNKVHFKNQLEMAEMVSAQKIHNRMRTKINCGLLPNFLLFAGYHGGFFSMLCLRLDKEISTSYFVILIPLWVFLIYMSAFLVVSGLASTNQRVNKCERIFLSALVPIGFILTIVFGLCLLDDYVQFPVYFTFVPLIVSLIFSYLYVRCLVKPSKSDFVKVKPEQSPQASVPSPSAFQESQQQQQQLFPQLSQLVPQQHQHSSMIPPGAMFSAPPLQVGQGSTLPYMGSSQSLAGAALQQQSHANMINHQRELSGPKPPLPGVRTSQSGAALQLALQQQAQTQQQLGSNSNNSGNNLGQLPNFQVRQAFY